MTHSEEFPYQTYHKLKMHQELPCYQPSQDNNKTTKSEENICIQVSHKCKKIV